MTPNRLLYYPLLLSLTLLLSGTAVPEREEFTVQIASYNQLVRAVSLGKKLQKRGLPKLFVETRWMDSTRRVYRLVAGSGSQPETLQPVLKSVQRAGFEDAFIKQKGLAEFTPVERIRPESVQRIYNTLGYAEHGIASYYAHQFHKKYTSNGELYDMDGISAAHQKIQFNSLVRVTNKKNGKQIVVRINDRGPFVKGRILDLSRGAARKLGMVRDGIVPIKLEVIRVGADGPRQRDVRPAFQNPDKKLYRTLTYDILGVPRRTTKYGVQVASYDKLIKAVNLGKELREKGYFSVYIQQGWTRDHELTFRVIVGDRAKSLARADQRELEKIYPGAFVKPHFNF